MSVVLDGESRRAQADAGSAPAGASQPGKPAAGEPVTISWSHPKGLVGLSLLNFLLTALTLGIYYFWGKTEVRRRIWSAIRINGEPLVYTGKGKELFLGFLIVFGLFFLPLILVSAGLQVAFGPESPAIVLFQLAMYLVIFFLIGVGIYRARRYRLSRTNWRGIRGALVPKGDSDDDMRALSGPAVYQAQAALKQRRYACPLNAQHDAATRLALERFQRDNGLEVTGQLDQQTVHALGLRGAEYRRGGALSFAWTNFWSMSLIPLTLGWIVPWRTNLIYRRLTNDTAFGSRFFRYSASSKPLYLRYVVLWVGLIALYLALYFGMIAIFGDAIVARSQGLPVHIGPTTMALGVLLVLVVVIAYSGLSAWYSAKVYNHLFGNTRFDNARLSLKATAWSLVWIVVSNVLIVLLSLGILRPIAQARLVRYFVERLEVEGSVDFASIAQSQAQLDATGEGLAEAFDIDAF